MRIRYLGPPEFAPLSMLPGYATEGDADVLLVHPRAGVRLREIWPDFKFILSEAKDLAPTGAAHMGTRSFAVFAAQDKR